MLYIVPHHFQEILPHHIGQIMAPGGGRPPLVSPENLAQVAGSVLSLTRSLLMVEMMQSIIAPGSLTQHICGVIGRPEVTTSISRWLGLWHWKNTPRIDSTQPRWWPIGSAPCVDSFLSTWRCSGLWTLSFGGAFCGLVDRAFCFVARSVVGPKPHGSFGWADMFFFLFL